MLGKALLVQNIIALGIKGIRKMNMCNRRVTEDREKSLLEAAHNSVKIDGEICKLLTIQQKL